MNLLLWGMQSLTEFKIFDPMTKPTSWCSTTLFEVCEFELKRNTNVYQYWQLFDFFGRIVDFGFLQGKKVNLVSLHLSDLISLNPLLKKKKLQFRVAITIVCLYLKDWCAILGFGSLGVRFWIFFCPNILATPKKNK